MKRFRFRLESVRRLREHELDEAVAALRVLETQRASLVDRAADLDDRLHTARRWLDGAVREGAPAEELALRADGLASGRLRLAQVKAELAELDPFCDRARMRVAEARARVRSLERLRDRQLEHYRVELLREEQQELDEIAGRVRGLGARRAAGGGA